MSTKANYDGSVCDLCKVKINKGEEILNHNNGWCHEKCVNAIGPTSPSTVTPKETSTNKKVILDPAPALIDFVYQENKTLLEIEALIKEMHDQLGIPINGQQIGMHTREIYLQAKKTNLIKASKLP